MDKLNWEQDTTSAAMGKGAKADVDVADDETLLRNVNKALRQERILAKKCETAIKSLAARLGSAEMRA